VSDSPEHEKGRKPPPDPHFEALIHHIQESRGIDFRGYKRTSLRRRIKLRMDELGIGQFERYQAMLEADPREFAALLNTVLINVTSFFRDPEAWDVLREQAVPAILARHGPNEAIRIWSVGCASGEEPYSVAMLFAEALGAAECCRRVKIYATDLDEDALQAARHATYSPREVESVPFRLLEEYFERTSSHYVFQRELRKCVIFGRHDVVRDAPISRIDLLLCRNLLIYLETETQNVVLPRLHYALAKEGFLFLGKAETQLGRSRLFEPLDPRHRIFVKLAREPRRLMGGALAIGPGPGNGENGATLQRRLLESIIDAGPVAYLAVDQGGTLIFSNVAARRLLAVDAADIGRPFQDLSISYRPAELRSLIEEANRERRPVHVENLAYHRSGGEALRLSIDVMPLADFEGGVLATLIAFTDTSRVYKLQQELEAAQDSLETTVEELQSANEELETTNEELQSTNEELETMNEELRSTNEELEVANEELRRHAEQASESRDHLESVLRGLNSGVIVLGPDLTVECWNRWNEDVWGLRAEEALSRHFFALDIGLPVALLREPVEAVLDGSQPSADLTLASLNRQGRQIRCRVRITRLRRDGGPASGLVLFVEDVTEEVRDEENARYIGRILKRSLNELYFLEPFSLRFRLINHGSEAKLGFSLAELRHRSLVDLMPGVSEQALRVVLARC
jgi:two-component system CheB/CheR fusion protein